MNDHLLEQAELLPDINVNIAGVAGASGAAAAASKQGACWWSAGRIKGGLQGRIQQDIRQGVRVQEERHTHNLHEFSIFAVHDFSV